MMTDVFKPQKKFTNEEIISAITFLDQVGKLTDEELKERDLQIGEVQKVNHFLGAVWNNESTMLPKQASTLLRLTPLLAQRGSTTVHNVILSAMPKVLEAYGKTTELTERKSYVDAIKTAGMVCMNRRLVATTRDNRLKELQMFEPFIGETPTYREAKARFFKRRGPSAGLLRSLNQQPANTVRRYTYNGAHINRSSYG